MRPIKSLAVLGKWILVLAFVGGLLAAAYVLHERTQTDRPSADGAPPAKFKAGVIKLSKQYAASFGIEVSPAVDIAWVPKTAVYGRVVPNPRMTSEIRAAFAGRLRAANGKWPGLASHVKAHGMLGHLEIRVGPQDRLDLMAKLTDARMKQEGARKVLDIQQARVKRFEMSPPSFARSELDAALIAQADAETQLGAAEAAMRLYHDALTALDQRGDVQQPTWQVPVTVPADGEVVELAAAPDMLVEAGGLIARVVDFRRALVRVDLPLALLTGAPPATLKLLVLPPTPPALAGPTNRPLPPDAEPGVTADLVGVASQLDPTLQAAGYLYEVTQTAETATTVWRPGLFVKSYLDVKAAKPVPAVTVPKSALLYHQGRALVYVKLPGDPKYERYERREVTVLGRHGDSWVIETGVDADDLVVTTGALALLSEEFRADVDD